MTRNEIAVILEIESTDTASCTERCNTFALAAEELRKSCSNCHWWSRVLFPNHGGAARCTTLRHLQMPEDGSGFCHEWVSK